MKLILIRDGKLTFDFVMGCLQTYLAYPKIQIQSILSLVNNTGQTTIVESDDIEKLNKLKESFVSKGLTIKIED